MTLSQAIDRVRLLARVESQSHTDTQIKEFVNDGQEEFSKDVHGFVTEDYLDLKPIFDLRTSFSANIFASSTTFATGAMFSANADDVRATAFCTALETGWLTGTSATVAWLASTWQVRITIPGATSIAVTAPTHKDQIDGTKLIGGAVSVSGSVWTGGIPTQCSYEATLPSTFIKMKHVEWDYDPLVRGPKTLFMSPEYRGIPKYYGIFDQQGSTRIRIYPQPNRRKLLHVVYKKLASRTASTTAALSIPRPYHMAPVYYAASQCKVGLDESGPGDRFYAQYMDQVAKYSKRVSNESTSNEPEPVYPYSQARIIIDGS